MGTANDPDQKIRNSMDLHIRGRLKKLRVDFFNRKVNCEFNRLNFPLVSKRKNLPLDDDLYDALYILIGEKSLHYWPKKGDKRLRQRVYRKLQSDIYVVKEIHDPTVGQPKKRMVEKATNCNVVEKSSVSQLVDRAYYHRPPQLTSREKANDEFINASRVV